ncbi:hypothetical protein HN873_066530, partial [Arachis hypogaea]
ATIMRCCHLVLIEGFALGSQYTLGLKLPNNMQKENLNMEEIFGSRKVPLEAITKPRLPNHLYHI